MFRTMRRHGQQLEQDACVRILKDAPRGVLAVLGENGYPYTIPMNFVYDEGRIYFHSAVAGHKLDAVAAEDKCSFCVLDEGVQEPNDWWYHFNSVVAFGRIRVVADEAAKREALFKLGNKYFPTGYDTAGDVAKNFSRVAILELTIEHMTGKHVREK